MANWFQKGQSGKSGKNGQNFHIDQIGKNGHKGPDHQSWPNWRICPKRLKHPMSLKS